MKNSWKLIKLVRISLIIILLVVFHAIPLNSFSSYQISEGEDFIAKGLFYSSGNKKGIVNIDKFPSCPSSAPDIAIFDCYSMHRVDMLTGTLKRKVDFKNGCVFLPTLYAPSCDNYIVYNAGGGFSDIETLDRNGNNLWNYKPPKMQVYQMTAGDLDKDGEVEFYLATNKGLHRLNSKGEKCWERGRLMWNVGIVDFQNHTPSQIVIKPDEYKLLEIYNHAGTFVREVNLEVKISEFKICNWPNSGHLLAINHDNIYTLDLNGKVIFHHKLGLGLDNHEIYWVNGMPAILKKNIGAYLAVILQFRRKLNKSALCIFSPEGKLVYQETLPGNACLTVVPSAIHINDGEALLVGDGTGNVYRYEVL